MKEWSGIKLICSLATVLLLITVAVQPVLAATSLNRGVIFSPEQTGMEITHPVISVVTEQQNTGKIHVDKGTLIIVKLAENPTTAYQWDMIVMPGLRIIDEIYIPSDMTENRLGSGGIHIWAISTEATGDYVISAIYKQPWEPVTGNEKTFLLNVIVS